MAKFRLVLSLAAIAVLSGCSVLFPGFYSYSLKGRAETMISDVIAPDLLYVGEGSMYRKVYLLGVAPMNKDHENYEHVMKALSTLRGTEIRVSFPGKDFWRAGPMRVLIYYDSPHEILPETGKSVEDENVLLNAYVLRHGFGRFYSKGQKIPETELKELRQAEAEARSSGLGVWERAKLGR